MITQNMPVKGLLLSLVSMSVLSSQFAFAQIADIEDCRTIEDRQARFECYDRTEAATSSANTGNGAETAGSAQRRAVEQLPVITRPVRSQSQQSTSDSTAQAPKEEVSQQIDDFGRVPEGGQTRVLEGADGKAELIDTVASMRQNRPGMWLITLASGQRWQQTITKQYPLKVGEEIRIYPTRWGSSYRLTSKRLRGFIQVKRLD